MAKNVKKRKPPIFKYAMEEYVGELKLPIDSDIIDYKELTEKFLQNKEDFRIVFDTCVFKKTTINHNVFIRSEFIDCKFTRCN